LLIEKRIHGREIKKELFISFRLNRWFLVAWLITPVISIAAFGVSLFFPAVTFSTGMEGMFAMFRDSLSPEQIGEMHRSMETLPVHPFWIALIQGLVAGITINAVAGFGEELGWRGFLLRQVQHLSFLKAAAGIGFVWGIWHAPLILKGHNYPQHPVAGVFMMTAWCMLLSPLFLYITIKARSVIAAAVMHGTLNGTAGLAIMMVTGGNDLTAGITGLSGFIALTIFFTAFFIYDRYISRERIMFGTIERSIGRPVASMSFDPGQKVVPDTLHPEVHA
jgi:membrane protease YdiL (CAAX protease family)